MGFHYYALTNTKEHHMSYHRRGIVHQIEEMVLAIENAADTDITLFPPYQVRLMLRDELLALGMNSQIVNDVTTQFSIVVSQTAWDDYNDMLVRMVKAIAKLTNSIYRQLQQDFSGCSSDVIITMLNGAEIKLDV